MPFAGHRQLAEGSRITADHAPVQGKRLADAKPGAIEQQQQRRVTLAEPVYPGGGRRIVHQITCLIRRERSRQPLLLPRRSKSFDGWVVQTVLTIEIAIKIAKCCQPSR